MAEDITLLEGKLRDVTEEDKKKLRKISYSKMDLFGTCSYQFDLKYNKKNYPEQIAIHLDLGTLCHKVLEIKGDMKARGVEVDYKYLLSVLERGIIEETDKGKEVVIGLADIKKKHGFEKWFEADNKSGMNYEEKVKLFTEQIIHNEIEDEDWTCFGTELSFEFVYKYGENEDGSPKEIIIHGFIDRVDVDNAEEPTKYRVVDYKTSKQSFDVKKLPTPLQQCIYGIALYQLTGVLPEEYEYSFILINERQKACTKGYLKRVVKKLDKILNDIDSAEKDNIYKPSPTPLCYWCSFCKNNPDAARTHNTLCPYYSLWTPTNKSFSVNQDFNSKLGNNMSGSMSASVSAPVVEPTEKRKLIF